MVDNLACVSGMLNVIASIVFEISAQIVHVYAHVSRKYAIYKNICRRRGQEAQADFRRHGKAYTLNKTHVEQKIIRFQSDDSFVDS